MLAVSSCASIEQSENITVNQLPVDVDENKKFIEFLESDWEQTLINNPLFATYTGDKRFNEMAGDLTQGEQHTAKRLGIDLGTISYDENSNKFYDEFVDPVREELQVFF